MRNNRDYCIRQVTILAELAYALINCLLRANHHMKRQLVIPAVILTVLAYQTGTYIYQDLERKKKAPELYDLATNQFIDESQLPDFHHRALVDVGLNTAPLCPDDTSALCLKQVIQLQRQVVKEYPISIPQPNVPPLISAQEAVSHYEKYVSDHTGEPVLIVFKQLYPSILLNNYGILASNDHTRIRYFTEHMLEARSNDFATLAKSLSLLKSDIPTDQFDQWVDAAIGDAEKREAKEVAHIGEAKRRLAQLAGTGNSSADGQKMKLYAARWLLSKLEQTTISADLIQLRRLRQPARQ